MSLNAPPRSSPPVAPGPAGRHRVPRRLRTGVLALWLGPAVMMAAGVALVRTELWPRPAETVAAGRPGGSFAQPYPPAPPTFHRLAVRTHPESVRMQISHDGEVLKTVRTPFAGRLPAGPLTLTLTHRGRNRLVQQVDLSRKRTLELWLDPAGLLHHQVGEFFTGSNPKQVAFTPDSREIWVTNLGGHGVQVFDARTGKRLDEIRLGQHGGVEVIFTRDGATAFVSQMETATVYEIDTATRRVRRVLDTGGVWSKVMALSQNEGRLYVANWSSDNVSEIDLGSGKVRRLLPTVRTPRGLYPTADGKRLYVAGYDNGELQRISLRTGRSKVLLTTGGAMRHLVGDEAHGRLYAGDMATDEIFVVDLLTEKVRKLADTDHLPNTIDLSPDGRVLYVSNRGANNPESYYIPGPEWGSVLAINTATGEVLDAMVGGNQTTGLDVSPDGRIVAFSDFLDNRVSLFAIPPFDALESGNGGRYEEHLADIPKS